MSKKIVIGICTYRNPVGLKKLLLHLAEQPFDAQQFQLLVIVVDNDCSGDNDKVLADLSLPFSIELVKEPEKGLTNARNTSIRSALSAHADAFIFIDDDEYPSEHWLVSMLTAWQQFKAHVVTGPVIGVIPVTVTHWVAQSKIFDKFIQNRKTGDEIVSAFTYNTLIDAEVLKRLGATFHPQFSQSGGEDVHYFTRAKLMGFKFIWCQEALLYEDVPASRVSRTWLIKRYYRSGCTRAAIRLMFESTTTALMVCSYNGVYYIFTGLALGLWGWLSRQPAKRVLFYTKIPYGLGYIMGMFGFSHEEYNQSYRNSEAQ